MSKSLYGYEKRQLESRVFEGETSRHYKKYEGVIQYIVSSYKQLLDLPENVYKELKTLLNDDFEIISGLFFIVLMQNNRYVIIRSPYEDDELRCIYGSDGNIKGRMIEVYALDSTASAISSGRNVRITGSYRCNLQDPDENIPVILSGLFGHSVQAENKMYAFKKNVRSGRGIIK